MVNFITNQSKSDTKKLSSNFIALGLVQVTNFLIPILTFPYLTRTLGIEEFGNVSFVLSLMIYLVTVIDYGFSLSATKEVALHKGNTLVLSKLYSEVIATRFVLFIICLIIICILMHFVPRFTISKEMLLLSSVYLLGSVLLPLWFFQGLERMKNITIINLLCKIVTLVLVFFIINEKSDYIYVVLLYGVANIIGGIIGIVISIMNYNIRLAIPSWRSVKSQLKSGFYLFINNLAILSFGGINVVILGFFVNDSELGKYSIAEKIAFLVWQVLSTLSQAIYPHICKLAQESHSKLVDFTRGFIMKFGVLILIGCVTLFITSEILVELVVGVKDVRTTLLLKILSFHGFIIFLNIPAYQTLLAYDLQKYTSKLFTISALLNLTLTSLLCWQLGALGAALSALIIQIFVTLSLYYLLEKNFKQYSLIKPYKHEVV